MPAYPAETGKKESCWDDCQKTFIQIEWKAAPRADDHYQQIVASWFFEEKMCEELVHWLGIHPCRPGSGVNQKIGWTGLPSTPKKIDLGPATDDGHETRVLHHLLKLARKRKLGAAARPTMSSVDLLDTIPMEINEDRRHHSSVCWVIFSINLSNAYVDKWRIQQFTQDTCFKNRMMINQSLQTWWSKWWPNRVQ